MRTKKLSVRLLKRYKGGRVTVVDNDRHYTISGKILRIEQDGGNLNIHYCFVDDEGEHNRHYEFDPTRFACGTEPGRFDCPSYQVTMTLTAPP